MRDKFPVRYERWQSLEIDVNYKVYLGHALQGFQGFIFLYVFKHVASQVTQAHRWCHVRISYDG